MRASGCFVAQRHAAQKLPCGSTPCSFVDALWLIAMRPSGFPYFYLMGHSPVVQRLVSQRPVVCALWFGALQLNVLWFNELRLDTASHPGLQHFDLLLSQPSALPTAASHPGSQHID